MKKENSAKKYQLTLTTKQVQVLMEASEIYARLGIGQFRDALEKLPLYADIQIGWNEDMDEIGRILSKYTKHNVNGGQSCLSIDGKDTHESAKIAWDLYQVIRHKVSWERAVEENIVESMGSSRKWPEMFGVNYDDPFVVSEELLAKIKKEEE